MQRYPVVHSHRVFLLTGASAISIGMARTGLLLATGAAIALGGMALTLEQATAADVVCAPDASGTAIASAAETCSGLGDKINYATPATVASTITLSGVVISAAAGDAVSIVAGGNAQSVFTTGGGSITATAGNGILLTSTGTGTVSVGSAASRIGAPIKGGNGALAANGIRVEGNGDVNLFSGNQHLHRRRFVGHPRAQPFGGLRAGRRGGRRYAGCRIGPGRNSGHDHRYGCYR